MPYRHVLMVYNTILYFLKSDSNGITCTKLFLALFTLSIYSVSFSQALPGVKEPKFQSPNAASLGKFGDTPIGYHTGVPQISIPIFTVTEGGLSVPISLNYHSNGVKVDETASWVGLGWNLSAGGSISRTIMGGPDEGKSTSFLASSTCGYKGWFRDYGMPTCLNLNVNDCGSTNQGDYRGAGYEWSCYAKYMAATYGNVDTEPDMFSFSIPGYSGKFFFDANRKAHMTPEDDLFISPEVSPNMFNTWKIIASDGTKYFFGGSPATETTYSDAGYVISISIDNRTATTWYLTRMESMNGEDWIQFEYQPEQSSYGTKASQTYIRGAAGTQNGSYSYTSGMTITASNGWRLSRITTSSGNTTVDFNATSIREDLTAYTSGTIANTMAKALNSIQIAYGSKCKKFTLGLSYFLSDRTNPFGVTPETAFDAKRLKLTSIQESTCDGTINVPAYQFQYDETYPLQRRYSFNQDHWGYANGASNTTILPPFNDPFNGQPRPGANKEPNEIFMKSGILTRVTYPTGGYSNFVYEAHRETPTSAIVGGLRIKSTEDNDGYGSTITKNYSYPLGLLYGGAFSNMQNPASNLNVFPSNFYDFGFIFNSSPNPPLQASHGYHIGYAMVEVSSPGIGKSVYKYTNSVPLYSNAYPKPSPLQVIGTAQLFSEEHFDANGVVKQSTVNTYGTTGGNVSVTAKKVMGVHPLNAVADPSLPYPLYTDYTISTRRHHLVQKTTYQDGVTTVTNYTHDDQNLHNNPKAIEVTNSQGILRRTEFTYPTDIGSGVPNALWYANDPNFKNLLGAPVEQRNLVSGVLRSKMNNQFTQQGSAVLLTSSKKYPSGTSEFVEDQFKYNELYDLVNMYSSNTGVNRGYLWGYNNSLPVAEATNARNDKFITYNNTTANTTFSMSGPPPATQNVTFTVDYPGTVYLKLGVSGWQAHTTRVSYSSASPSIGSANNVTLANSIYCPGPPTIATFNNVPAGTHTITLSLSTPDSGISSLSACGLVESPDIVPSTTGITEFFYEGFEEGTATGTANPHTGKKYLLGDYTTTFTMPNARTYHIEYWYLSGGQWIYAISTYTNGMVLTAGDAIDDVRIYPTDARMKSYTYDPGVGITSVLDENGQTLSYIYDSLGRLLQIKNEKGGIEKQFGYTYKN